MRDLFSFAFFKFKLRCLYSHICESTYTYQFGFIVSSIHPFILKTLIICSSIPSFYNPSFCKFFNTSILSIHPCMHASTHPPIHPSFPPSIYPFVHQSISTFIHSSMQGIHSSCPFIHPSIHLVYQSICSDVHPSILLLINMSVAPPIDLCLFILSIHPSIICIE